MHRFQLNFLGSEVPQAEGSASLTQTNAQVDTTVEKGPLGELAALKAQIAELTQTNAILLAENDELSS